MLGPKVRVLFFVYTRSRQNTPHFLPFVLHTSMHGTAVVPGGPQKVDMPVCLACGPPLSRALRCRWHLLRDRQSKKMHGFLPTLGRNPSSPFGGIHKLSDKKKKRALLARSPMCRVACHIFFRCAIDKRTAEIEGGAQYLWRESVSCAALDSKGRPWHSPRHETVGCWGRCRGTRKAASWSRSPVRKGARP